MSRSAGAAAPFPGGTERQSPGASASCGSGAQVDSQPYLNLNELFSPGDFGKLEKALLQEGRAAWFRD